MSRVIPASECKSVIHLALKEGLSAEQFQPIEASQLSKAPPPVDVNQAMYFIYSGRASNQG